MDDDEPRAGELTTANYGWTKPNVGDSDDAWGGMLNADLDGIDSTVKSVSNVANAALTTIPIASTTVLGGVKVDGTTIHAASDGTLSGTPTSGPPVIISDTAPSSPAPGALWWDSVGGQLYTFFNDGNTQQWVIAVNSGALLAPASTTVLGGVKVDGTTIKAAADGTISTTVVPMGDNRIINGDMRIDQRNNGASGTTQGYTVDRWQFSATLATKGAWQRSAFNGLGFPYALTFTSNSAYTPLAGDTFTFLQPIEADMVSDFQWGTANAQPVTLSFIVLSSLTGTFGGSIRNAASTRSYPFTYSIPSASTATKISITIPGDTAGTWVMSGNALSILVAFDMGTGATYRGPAGAWAGQQYNGVTGSVNVVSTNGATFYLTGVKLEIGSIATPFNRQSLAKSMADCERYYSTGYINLNSYNGAGIAGQFTYPFKVDMRAMPTMTTNPLGSSNCSAFTMGSRIQEAVFNYTVSALGPFAAAASFTASAEL